MDESLVIIIGFAIVLIGGYMMFKSLNETMKEISKKLSQQQVNVTYQAPAQGMSIPAVNVNDAQQGFDAAGEVMAVIAAAVKSFESEYSSVPAQQVSPAYVSEVQPVINVPKYRRQTQSIWISTARYESHQRL
ncbi:MAG: hypothetical protein LBU94_01825 [Clostridiales bacterium]|jgi:hypothetical protein|nr:hypothetical protein [Clostridiales bacterium]